LKKKKQKNFPLLRALTLVVPAPAGAKVFLLLFFQKKKRLLSTS
jgi:hypothetical protein